MPRSVTIYRVFVASPGDVKDERGEVKKVIDIYNQMHSIYNVKLEMACWEDSTHPSFGDYPQSVINSQIGDDYDFFIGILWARFGTPTPKYESGTEEEFYRAYNRFRKGDKIGIMIYRKDESIPPSEIDTTQLQRVNDFISKVGELGGYYFSFKTQEEFHDMLLKHLDGAIKDLTNKTDGNPLMVLSKKSNDLEDGGISTLKDNWGLLDYSEFIVQTSMIVNSNIDCISNLTIEIGDRMRHYTYEMNSLRRNHNELRIKSILLNAAKDMNKYAVEIEEPNSNWYRNYLELQKAIKGMMSVSDGLVSKKEWEDLVEKLHYMTNQMGAAYSAMRQLYTAVDKLPKIMQQLIIARNNVCNKLKKIISNLKEGKRYCEETIEYIEDAIHPISE